MDGDATRVELVMPKQERTREQTVPLTVRLLPNEKRALEIAVFEGDAHTLSDAVRQAVNAKWGDQIAKAMQPIYKKRGNA